MTKNYIVVFASLVNEDTQQTAEYSYNVNAESIEEARLLAEEQHAVAVNARIMMSTVRLSYLT